jgi:DNA-binding CsgD family transcriptional regulator
METGDGRKFEPRPVETPRLASERATLDRLLQAALRGQGTALVVRGEPGLGKTTLVKHVIESVSGFRLVTLSGIEAEQDLSFAGLHRLCAPMLDGLGRLPHPQREALAVAFGERPGVAADRFFLGLAVLGLIAVVGADQPLVLVVDDAQWLDPPSRQVLAFVARRLPPQPVAVVFTASEPIEELEGLPELVLRNLTDAEAHALLAAVVPGPLDPKVRDRFLAESQGNPRTLLDLACSLPPERLAGGLGLPAAPAPVDLLTSRLRSQLGGLPVQVRRLLLVAAADPEGDPTLLSRAAARLDIGAGAIDEARSLGLLGFGSCIAFRQPVMRSVVYHGASPDERRCVHRALADAIDPQAARDLRAWHQAHATRARDEDVAHELERSADRARARGGLAAMAALLERSADLTPEPVRRAQRVLAAAQAAFDAGSLGAAAELVASTSAGPLDEFGRAGLRRLRAKLAVAMRRAPDAPASLLDAATTLERFDVRLARDTYLDAFEATMLVGQPDTDDRLTDIAAAAVAAPPAESPVAADLLLDGLAMLFTEDCELAAPTLRRAVDALSTTGDVRWGGLASRAAAELLDADAMVELATRSVGVARDTGALAHLPTALDHLAAVHVQAGEFGLAARLIEEARAISTATGQAPVTCASLVLGAWRGSVTDTADSTEPGRRDVVIRGDGRQITDTAYATAVLDNGMGRYRHALDATRAACGREGPASYWLLPELVEAAARADERAIALAACARLTERAQISGTEWALGIEARSLALVTDGPAAEKLYREAIERLGRCQASAHLARAHLVYGEWLRRERRRRDAREQLRIAHDMFSTMGADAFALRTHRELLATGERAHKRAAETAGDLTPQEAQIAQLARDGHSNPQIGTRLFISARTVEYHLHKVFVKLGINSRNQLAYLPDLDSAPVPLLGQPG